MTAAEGGFADLGERLRELRVHVRERPLLTFAPPESWTEVDAAIARLDQFRTLVVTSPRGAAALVDRLVHAGRPLPRRDGTLDVWAAGATTAAALGARLGPVRTPARDLLRRMGASAAIARTLLAEASSTGPVLYACGADRRDELPTLLTAAGMQVHEVVCYRTVLATEAAARAAVAHADIVIVSSPSVASLLARSCPPGLRPELLAVGPTTAERARSAGWVPAAIAERPDADALTAGVRALLSSR